MSEAVIDTLVNQDIQLSRGGLYYDGVTFHIYTSDNISSIINPSTGTYQCYFIEPMADSAYAVSSTICANNGTSLYPLGYAYSLSPSSFFLECRGDGVVTNRNNIHAVVFGNY